MQPTVRLPAAACVLCGLSGAGKSTLALELERTGQARRVRRIVTRPKRNDDDPNEIAYDAAPTIEANDVVIPGWGKHIYVLRASSVAEVRLLGLIPVLEVGEYSAAATVAAAFPPAAIVLVRRSIDPERLTNLLTARGMSEDDIAQRIASIEADRRELEVAEEHVDVVVDNYGSVDDIRRAARVLLDRLRLLSDS